MKNWILCLKCSFSAPQVPIFEIDSCFMSLFLLDIKMHLAEGIYVAKLDYFLSACHWHNWKKSFSSGTVGGMCHACHSNNKRWLLLHHGEKNCIFCTICPFCLRLMIISSCNLWVGIFSYCASASFYICFITNLHSSILFFLH